MTLEAWIGVASVAVATFSGIVAVLWRMSDRLVKAIDSAESRWAAATSANGAELKTQARTLYQMAGRLKLKVPGAEVEDVEDVEAAQAQTETA